MTNLTCRTRKIRFISNYCSFQSKASGGTLFEQVCKQLNLLETDYFGLEYNDNRGATVSQFYYRKKKDKFFEVL